MVAYKKESGQFRVYFDGKPQGILHNVKDQEKKLNS